jgi:hypothetical protein
MPSNAHYNPSLRAPIIDIIVAIILIVSAGYVWFHSRGEAELAAAHADLRNARAQNAAELQEALDNKRAVEEELAATIQDRDDQAQIVQFLQDRIEIETQTILESRERDERLTDETLDLRTEIQRGRDRRRAYTTDVFETNQRIEETETIIAGLEGQAQERNDELGRLDVWIAEARLALEENPPSRYPEKSGLASVVEVKDESQTVLLSLSREVKGLKAFDLGLLGSLGLSTDGESALKEGGLYANLPLAPRRASIDLEGGISQLQSRKRDYSDTGPFAGATLRLAPKAGERLFIVGGTRYSHEDLAIRLGLAIGRR